MLRRFLLVWVLFLVIAGCSSAVTLRHPATGQTVTCEDLHWGRKLASALAVGLMGVRNPSDGGASQRQIMDRHADAVDREDRRQRQCITQAERLGYERMAVGAPSARIQGGFTKEDTLRLRSSADPGEAPTRLGASASAWVLWSSTFEAHATGPLGAGRLC